MPDIVIEVQERLERGKNVARRLRASGRVPAVVYGCGIDAIAVSVGEKTVRDCFRKGAHDNSVFLLKMENSEQKRHVMIREICTHPISRAIEHVDFIRVDLDKQVKVHVHINLLDVEESTGVKLGGILDFSTRSVDLSCKPGQVPSVIDISVKDLDIGGTLRIADLPIDLEDITVLDDLDRVVVTIKAKEREEVAETDEVDGEVAASDEDAEE